METPIVAANPCKNAYYLLRITFQKLQGIFGSKSKKVIGKN